MKPKDNAKQVEKKSPVDEILTSAVTFFSTLLPSSSSISTGSISRSSSLPTNKIAQEKIKQTSNNNSAPATSQYTAFNFPAPQLPITQVPPTLPVTETKKSEPQKPQTQVPSLPIQNGVLIVKNPSIKTQEQENQKKTDSNPAPESYNRYKQKFVDFELRNKIETKKQPSQTKWMEQRKADQKALKDGKIDEVINKYRSNLEVEKSENSSSRMDFNN